MILKKENLLVSNIMWSLLAKIFAMVFYFCADVFYARRLGVELYAEWVFFFSIAHMAFYIGWFGINTSAKVHITKDDRKENCLGAALRVRLFFSIVISAAVFFIMPFFAKKMGYPQPYADLKKLMYIMAGMLFFNSFTDYFKHLYVGIQEFKKLCMITAVEYFLYCLFTIWFLFINNNPVSIAVGYCAAGVVILFCNFAIIIRKYDTKLLYQGSRDRKLQKKIIKYALPLVVTSLGGLILMEMDTFMLGLLGTEEQVATYSISKQLVSKATNVNMAIWTGTVSSLAMITKENFGEKKTKFIKVSRLNNAVSSIICIGFALFGRIAIQLVYGNEYMTAGKILFFLIPYYFLYCASALYATYLDFMGHAKTRALWFISVIVINLSLNYLLIPKYGAGGAAVATNVSIVPYTIYCLYDVRNIFKDRM